MEFTHIQKKLKNKNIALFGNSLSLIYKERPTIDKDHDVYIRINEGSPKKYEKYVGSKTDFLALSMNLDQEYIESLYGKIDGIIYFSPKNRMYLNDYLKENAIFYPYQNWTILSDMLGSRPSTGVMAIDFLWHYVEFKELHLYGFDSWETPNRNTNIKHVGPHDPLCEKEYISRLIMETKKVFRHE